ncbi:MAG: hypothetical protein ACRESP_22890, partial [Pseudomonas sp.]
YGGLVAYLSCLVHAKGWEATGETVNNNWTRLNDLERQVFTFSVATDLQSLGCTGLVLNEIISLLQFDEGWDAAVYTVADCFFKCGEFSSGRAILSQALHADCAGEFMNLLLAQSFMYAPDSRDRDLKRCFEICLEGLEHYPESYDLCNLAGQAAANADPKGEAFFQRTLALLEEIPIGEHTSSSSLAKAVALCNLHRVNESAQMMDAFALSEMADDLDYLLYRALLACVLRAGDVSRRYEAVERQLGAVKPFRARAAVRCQLVDLQLYGERGLLSNWQARHASAEMLYRTISE